MIVRTLFASAAATITPKGSANTVGHARNTWGSHMVVTFVHGILSLFEPFTFENMMHTFI